MVSIHEGLQSVLFVPTVVKSELRTHVSFDENIGALHYILALLELVCVPLSSALENAAWKYFP
jgi:hypothetical protein